MIPVAGIFNWITAPIESTLLTLAVIVVGWMTKKWLLPFLSTALRKQIAEYVLIIADEVTDWLVAKYPDKEVWRFLDKAVDKVIDVCGVSQEVAQRAVEASLSRKGITNNKK